MRFQLVSAVIVLSSAISTVFCIGTAAAEVQVGRKLALLVGVKDYDHAQLNNLQYAENDVEELADVLRKQKFEVVLLTTHLGKQDPKKLPTAANVKAELANLLKNVTKRDLALIGLAGHGIQPLGSDKAYFCPQDANPKIVEGKLKEPSTVAFPDLLICIDDLLATLDDSGVGQKLLLVDACRNDPTVRGRRGVDRVKVSALPPETGVLLSCSNGQFAFEHKSWGKGGHGAFFSAVIDGLNGRAGIEGVVTWETLVPYVRRQVPAMVQEVYGKDGGEQRPNLVANISAALEVLASVAPLTSLKPELRTFPAPTTAPNSDDTPPLAVAPFDADNARQHQQAWAKHLNAEVEFENTIGMKLQLIPPGEFQMGSPESEEDRDKEEAQRPMKIPKAFYLGKYEVTQMEYRKITGQNPSWFSAAGGGKKQVSDLNTDRCPAEQVSWLDALAFCNKLSEREGLPKYYSISGTQVTIKGGRGYRLPTEAEWEYSCRAGTRTPFHFGTSNNGENANIDGTKPYGTTSKGPYLERTTSVGRYASNQFGLHDMHGNVWELCQDWHDLRDAWKNSHDSRFTENDPLRDESRNVSFSRAMRGGDWFSDAMHTRSARRVYNRIDERASTIGFRVVLRVVPSKSH